MKTSELTGAALDWAVAKCEGRGGQAYLRGEKLYEPLFEEFLCYSTDWAQGGPIIERARIAAIFSGEEWVAGVCTFVGSGGDPVFEGGLFSGPTPLIAAMRCYVYSKLGDQVEVPEELV